MTCDRTDTSEKRDDTVTLGSSAFLVNDDVELTNSDPKGDYYGVHMKEQVFSEYIYEEKSKYSKEEFDNKEKAFKEEYLSLGHSNNFFWVKDHLYKNFENFYQLEIVIPEVDDREKIPNPDDLANHKFMLTFTRNNLPINKEGLIHSVNIGGKLIDSNNL